VVELQEVASLVLARRSRKSFEKILDFLKSPPQAKTICFYLRGQNGAIYTHFLYSPPQAKTIWLFFGGGNMGQYIHILGFFLGGQGGGAK
jgi:hypothetical protein